MYNIAGAPSYPFPALLAPLVLHLLIVLLGVYNSNINLNCCSKPPNDWISVNTQGNSRLPCVIDKLHRLQIASAYVLQSPKVPKRSERRRPKRHHHTADTVVVAKCGTVVDQSDVLALSLSLYLVPIFPTLSSPLT